MSRLVLSSGLLLSASLAVGFALLLVAGLRWPLRKPTRPLAGRLWPNVVLTGLAFAVGAVSVRPVAFGLAQWGVSSSFGVLNRVTLPTAVRGVAGFLLMDLTFYYWHRVNHTVPVLWRFHNVHHVDPDLDASTSFRFHFVEIGYSTAFRVLQVLLLGVTPLTYAVYEVVFQWGTVFHHSNVRLPIRLERLLNLVTVTPRMHGVHHSTVKAETNSNYSVVCRWWDWLHRSLRLAVPQAEITIGVPGYLRPKDNALWSLLVMPFRKQRNYWLRPDGTRPTREPAPEETRIGRLME